MNLILAFVLSSLAQDDDLARLRRFVADLEAFGTRFVGADNHAKVTEHVKNVFRSMGYAPESHRFDFPRSIYWHNGDWSNLVGKPVENVVVRIPGTNPDLAPVIVSAHYDSINWRGTPNSIADPNARAPGADDAGSGMGVLFELAHRLRGRRFEREVRLVAFDAEEQGLVGSERYVKDLRARGGKVHAMINYDMVGFGDKLELEVPKESEWLLREFEQAHKDLALPRRVNFRVGPPRDAYESRGALRGSDHTHFIRTGYDAIAGFEATLDPDIWTRDFNPNYHKTTDTVDTLNLELMRDVAAITTASVTRMARPVPLSVRAGGTMRREAAGAGQFAAAYLVKEAMNGRLAVGDLAQPMFWGDLAAFTVASRAVARVPVFRAGLPLAAGMAAVQLLHGQLSWRDVAIDTASYVVAGAAVNLIADGLIYPALFAAGPPGWVAAGAYTVAKLAITLHAGEKLGVWLRRLFARESREEKREGVVQKLDAVRLESDR